MLDNIKVQKTDDYILSGYDIHTRVKPVRQGAPHTHEFIEIFYVLSGTSNHYTDKETKQISTGDIYILLPGDIHNHSNSHASKDFLYRDILIRPHFFSDICGSYSDTLYNDFSKKIIPTRIQLSSNELSIFENLFMRLSNADGKEIQIVTNLLIHELVSAFLKQKLLQKSEQMPSWLVTLISELNRPANFAIPLNDLIAVFHYTKPYMCSAFKRHVGMTITDYFNKNRITHANSLLNATDNTIKDICETLGFSNISHFYALYKKHFGKTPRKHSGG